MIKKITIYKLLLVAVCLASTASAQLSIQTNDYMPDVGTLTESGSANNADATIYNALTGGTGNMNFDFSPLLFSDFTISIVINPASAPFIDSFPDANLITVSIDDDSPSDSIWSYHNSVAQSFTNLGNVTKFPPINATVSKYDFHTSDYNFPLNYNDEWTTIRHRSMSFTGVESESFDTVFNHVDAFGTANYNGQTINCLRVNYVERITTITTVIGFPPSTTISTLEGAYFIGAGFNFFAAVQKSTFGLNDSYYATAVASFIKIPTDIKEIFNDNLPDDFTLAQNYPNPFNPSTEIQFTIPISSDVRLEIYDIQGRLTNVLVDRQLSAGTYTVDWNGTNNSGKQVASGVYFYRLSTGDFNTSKKMLLLK